MNVSVRKRARQRAMLMQAELDGRDLVETSPAFIAPMQLKAGIHTDDDEPPFWFAVRNARYNVAYALDAYPDELISVLFGGAGGIDRGRAADGSSAQ